MIGVIGSLLAVLLRRNTPELSLLLSLAAAGAAALLCAEICGEIGETLRELAGLGGMSELLLRPVIKCVGIALISESAAALCRDAQQSAAAGFVELGGALCALYTALPLLRSLFSVIASFL